MIACAEKLEAGLVFGTLARHLGFSSLHPCRVVYVLDDPGAGRFGFGLGTLPGHVMQGEERFLVRLDPTSGEVHYEVTAFSRPASSLGRLGRPVLRAFQRRFQRETVEAMRSVE